MFEQIVVHFTKKTIYRIGFVWAAEYAMLALIEDSPQLLKAATLVCALGGLVLLETHDYLRHKHIRFFWLLACCLGAIYFGFVGYAVYGVGYKWYVERGLKRIYSESVPLTLMLVNENVRQIPPFKIAFEDWEKRSADWITIYVGPFAHDHFLSRTQPTAFAGQGYGNVRGVNFHWADCAEMEYECYRARLEMDRANLLSILAHEKYAD